jgi:hypothetical protein
MRNGQRSEWLATTGLLVALVLLAGPAFADDPGAAAATATATATANTEAEAEPAPQTEAAAADKPKPRLDIYGFAMLDMGYQFGQNHPDWFDVIRPTKLPAYENEFGEDGHTYASVRQSRLGFKGYIPTSLGELKTIFEFEMFGTGVDAGQTTIRLRHAYGELGQVGAGQYWSPFMDIDVFPNSVEYWGPNGMAFFRNVQVRWMPIKGDSFLTIAIERPGASADAGVYAGRIELEGVKGRFPLPDLSAEYRSAHDWGYVEVAGILRKIAWDDVNDDQYDFTDSTLGWGVTVSSNVKTGSGVLRLQAVYGEGIQNYMNDAPIDVGIENDFDNPVSPVKGVALPMSSFVVFYDHNWNDKWSTSIGYSRLDMDNSDGQTPDAFKTGQYALVNLLHYPVPGVMMGGELQWGSRENFSDGFSSDDLRIQFSFKYNFSASIGGNS